MPQGSRGNGNGNAPEYAELGVRLRAARMERGLSLRVLATRLGVSPSLISQVETGRAKPSVSTLYALVNEFGISLDDMLFSEPGGSRAAGSVAAGAGPAQGRVAGPLADFASGSSLASATSVPATVATAIGPMPVIPVQPADTRKRIRLASGVVWERLTSVSIPNAEFIYVTYEVGGASTHEHEFQRHAGQEWGYVISGSLAVTIGFDEYVLGPGDAISFDSMTPHRMHNVGKDPVHGIWFNLGRSRIDTATASTVPAQQDLPAGE